jgi:putative ABC transport system substrate-binding protein
MDRRRFLGRVAGGLLAVPFGSRAQNPSLPVIGFLNSASADGFAYLVAAFRQGLKETGHVDGQNVAIEYRWAEGHLDRLPAMAGELVQRRVALIAAGGNRRARLAAKAATATIPIVFVTGGDPVKEGLVASLSRPGGNITGVTVPTNVLDVKRLELLNQVVPPAAAIAILVNPANGYIEAQLKDLRAAAGTMGRKIHILNATSEREIDAGFASLAPLRAGGLVVAADPLFNSWRAQLVELAARHRIPAIFEWREFAAAGGLMSYGSNIANGYREMGVYAGRILKGAKPADLPVLQAANFELVVNLNTAKALGIVIPQSLLLRADEVIR